MGNIVLKTQARNVNGECVLFIMLMLRSRR